jgi:hypothetical protein
MRLLCRGEWAKIAPPEGLCQHATVRCFNARVSAHTLQAVGQPPCACHPGSPILPAEQAALDLRRPKRKPLGAMLLPLRIDVEIGLN